MVGPEEGSAVVGGDVPALVNDVQKARLQNLEKARNLTSERRRRRRRHLTDYKRAAFTVGET